MAKKSQEDRSDVVGSNSSALTCFGTSEDVKSKIDGFMARVVELGEKEETAETTDEMNKVADDFLTKFVVPFMQENNLNVFVPAYGFNGFRREGISLTEKQFGENAWKISKIIAKAMDTRVFGNGSIRNFAWYCPCVFFEYGVPKISLG